MLFFSSRRRHTRCSRDWSSDVCSSDLNVVRRVARLGRAAGAALGRACGGVAVRAAFGAGTGYGGADNYRGDPLGRLAASAEPKKGVLGKRGGLGGRRIL